MTAAAVPADIVPPRPAGTPCFGSSRDGPVDCVIYCQFNNQWSFTMTVPRISRDVRGGHPALVRLFALGLIWIGATRIGRTAQSRYSTGCPVVVLVAWLAVAQYLRHRGQKRDICARRQRSVRREQAHLRR